MRGDTRAVVARAARMTCITCRRRSSRAPAVRRRADAAVAISAATATRGVAPDSSSGPHRSSDLGELPGHARASDAHEFEGATFSIAVVTHQIGCVHHLDLSATTGGVGAGIAKGSAVDRHRAAIRSSIPAATTRGFARSGWAHVATCSPGDSVTSTPSSARASAAILVDPRTSVETEQGRHRSSPGVVVVSRCSARRATRCRRAGEARACRAAAPPPSRHASPRRSFGERAPACVA